MDNQSEPTIEGQGAPSNTMSPVIDLESGQDVLSPTPTRSNQIRPLKCKVSMVWDHMTKKTDCDPNYPMCYYNYCKKEYLCDSNRIGTSTLKNHVLKCEKNPMNRIKGPMDKYETQLTGNAATERESENVGPSLIVHKYNAVVSRQKFAEMCIIDEMPFRVVDGQGFKAFIKSLVPSFQMPSHQTMQRDVLKIYEDEKEKLKGLFNSCACRVSLTTDTWTSVQNLNYMTLIAHFVDNAWKLRKRIINFCQVPNHKGETIGKYVEACLLDWGID